ncbi:MAG: hypothetical protein FJZ01_27465, partial [Candidatus Sericytochromatia bacterium]|nr:hypothetical protein [Candidatus Tanganyikabacteria bacterium]
APRPAAPRPAAPVPGVAPPAEAPQEALVAIGRQLVDLIRNLVALLARLLEGLATSAK